MKDMIYDNCKYNNYRLPYYKSRSPYDSYVWEYFAPITDIVIPNIIPNRYWISTFGRIWSNAIHNFVSYSIHGKGYFQIPLCTTNGNRITRKVHRIEMMTFMYFDGCEDYEVNHKDGNKQNNLLTNLEWCTHSENTIHAINMGLKQVFGNDYSVRLNNEQVKQIYELLDFGCYSTKEIKEILNIPYVSNTLIDNMRSGRARKPDKMKE